MHDASLQSEWPEGNHDYEGTTYHYVPFLNPGRNSAQRSYLRIVNIFNFGPANVTIISVDDKGASRGPGVRLSLPAGASRTLSVSELESGGAGFEGYLGEGVGKWRVFVFVEADSHVRVMSLLESPDWASHKPDWRFAIPFGDFPFCLLRFQTRICDDWSPNLSGKPSTASVTRRELAELTGLYVPAESGIEDWTGLQLAANLGSLTIRHEPAGSVPLEGLKELRYLDLGGRLLRPITDLSSVASLQSLEELRCECELSDLSPLRGLTNLLRIERIRIADVGHVDLSPLGALKNLRWLILAIWHTEADLSALSGSLKLEHLDLQLSESHWVDLEPLANLTNLEWLSLGARRYSRPLDTAILQPRLDLSPLTNLINLRYLDLSETGLLTVTPLSALTNLTALYLPPTGIDDLGPLSGLSRLQVLNLHRNGIADLSPLSGMSEMTSLNLGTNRISDLAPLSSMTKLTWLDIQANQISDLSPLSGLGSLSWLNASANPDRRLVALSQPAGPQSSRRRVQQDRRPVAASRTIRSGESGSGRQSGHRSFSVGWFDLFAGLRPPIQCDHGPFAAVGELRAE